MSVWAGLSGSGVVSRLALPQRAQPVELTRDWSCLWNRASRSTQMGWVVMKEAFRRGRREGGGSWVKKRKRSIFFSQLYFFKMRKKKPKTNWGATKNRNDKKEHKKTHPDQQNFPCKNAQIFHWPNIPISKAGRGSDPAPNKGSVGTGEQVPSQLPALRGHLQTWRSKRIVMGFILKLQHGSLDKRGEIERDGSLLQPLSFLFVGP